MKPETFIATDGSEVTLIHFITGSPARIVCMPGLTDFSATSAPNAQRIVPHIRSGEPGAVTCQLCKKTDDWKRAEQQLRAAIARANK